MRTIRASSPLSDVMRRYRPARKGSRVNGPAAAVIAAACIMLALVTLTVGTGLAANVIGGVAGAFDNAVSRLASHAPATAPPSGVALDTPVLDTPGGNGYTNQPSIPILGSIPGAAVGKSGYTIHVYRIAKDGSQQAVASVPVGGTTRFNTPPVTLLEGPNSFVATLATPTGEGQPSPVVIYTLDTVPPKIVITSPASGYKATSGTVAVSGTCDAGSTVAIRNEQAPGGSFSSQVVGSDGKFKLTIPVVAGSNTVDLTATDQAGNASTTSMTIKRDYGQLAAHVAVSPSKFTASMQATLKLTLHATSFNGGPLANASVTFTVTIQGLGPIVSPELTTDATGTATWQVSISGASPGTGQASVLVTSPAGDQVTGTAPITTT
ncbi:MAG: Ig-like domain-containing protein [Candidatus Limnocylindrales bacterium]